MISGLPELNSGLPEMISSLPELNSGLPKIISGLPEFVQSADSNKKKGRLRTNRRRPFLTQAGICSFT
jgi:hypothetical protein